MPAVSSILAGVAIAGGLYSATEQKKSAKAAQQQQEKAEMSARKMAAEQKPLEEAATLQTDIGGSVLGNLGLSVEADMSKKKTSALGGTSTNVGLGFGNV